MGKRGYIIRVEDGRILVQHRAAFRPRTIVLIVIGYLTYCVTPGVRKILVDFVRHGDPVIGCFALLVLLIPILGGITWLLFTSGEVLSCDARELHIARRRTWGRWHRFRAPLPNVHQLSWAFRGGPKRRSFSVLTFECGGKRFDVLEDISRDDAARIVIACKALGLDGLVPSDVGEDMLRDIEERGWFINPLRPDKNETSPIKR